MGFEAEPLRFERQSAAAGERVVEGRQPVTVEDLPGAWMVRIRGASPPPTLPDLGSRPFQHLLVGSVLPEDQLFNEPEQAVPLQLRRHVAECLPVGLLIRHRACRRGGRRRRNCDLPAPRYRRANSGRRILRPTLLQRSHRGPLLLRVRQQHVHVLGRVIDHLRKDHRPRRSERTACPPKMQRARMPVPDRLFPRRGLVDCVEWQSHLDQLLAHATLDHWRRNQPSGSTTDRNGKRRKSASRVQMRLTPCSRISTAVCRSCTKLPRSSGNSDRVCARTAA